MREVHDTSNFRKNYSKLERSGRRNLVKKLDTAMDLLISGKKLPPSYEDHGLEGRWYGYRDCHVGGDWVLIYNIEKRKGGQETITFHATGNHANLFG